MTAIEVRNLHQRYGRRTALNGVDLTVADGEVVGLLGRNGAGKSTTVGVIAGLLRPDRGTARVRGLDPIADRREVRRLLGVQLQDAALHPSLTVRELVRLHRGFHATGADPDELIETLGLTGVRDTRFENLSGGEAQRTSIAVALTGRPRVALLDELTTGLDPEARRHLWRVITGLRADGMTVLLVSHAMEEVERLCDRVVLLDRGRVLATGTPAALIARTGGDTLDEAFLTLTGGAG
ncbi:ABC-2 type transport system ATP-binding protein [Catenuloplanes nepalensis]|uniref:ABC-2 type transport system ATP-binding protein n=1 Tax=Catenuloplanes nepalensis TaxID=587533 RepID=A0ABT9MQJ2_9ACTN|nr:ABC transporter ATP-binding protein [Catenuloplanes nepalensis]MDP9793682.1 ABC-2 type transport system ATP-binding protein [Catenuloplanes nepalensis]